MIAHIHNLLNERAEFAFLLILALATLGVYFAGGITWQIVALVLIASMGLLGSDRFDGLTAGPISNDSDEGESDER